MKNTKMTRSHFNMHNTIKPSFNRVVFIILFASVSNRAPPRTTNSKSAELRISMQKRLSVAAHTNDAYPIADPRNFMWRKLVLGAQQKLLKRSVSIVDLPTKLGLQERVEALPELRRGEDDLLRCLLGRAGGGDGERVVVEGDRRVGR